MKYTREFLEPIVKESVSVADVCRKLGIPTHGGANSHLGRSIDRLGIDRSHFLGRGHAKGKTIGCSYPIEEYLTNKRKISSNNLKKRLISEGFKTGVCEKCSLTHWMGSQLSFELHHIDCDHNNNEISNLQILCPNCHCVIHNELRKDKPKATRKRYKRIYQKKEKKEERVLIKKIETELVTGNIRVAYPRPEKRKVTRPPYEQLIKEVQESNYSKVGRKYGVSDNAIRKWIKIYEKYSIKK